MAKVEVRRAIIIILIKSRRCQKTFHGPQNLMTLLIIDLAQFFYVKMIATDET